MVYTILFLFGLYISSSYGNANWIVEVSQALNTAEVDKLTNDLQESKILKKACDIELNEQKVPYECFKLKKLGFTSDSRLPEGLNEECIMAAQRTEDLKIRANHDLPPNCLKVLSQKIALNRYRKGLE